MYLFYLIKWSHNKIELYEHLDFLTKVNMRKVKYILKIMNYEVTIELIYIHSDKRNNT